MAPTAVGVASANLNTSRQVGGSLGLAVLATIATDRTHSLLAAGHAAASTIALTDGYAPAFGAAAILALAALACSLPAASAYEGGDTTALRRNVERCFTSAVDD